MVESTPQVVSRALQDIEPGTDAAALERDFLRKLYFETAKFPGVATLNDHYLALAYAVRDRLMWRWVKSARTYLEGEHRTVIYLSAEYLLGPQLGQNLMSLGMERAAETAMRELGLDLEALIENEEEPGLGNGGLGRLAACFMDSLATLRFPAIGYGIRYEFGIFDQEIRDGWQVERTDRWLRLGNPWEIRRHDLEHTVSFGGHTEPYLDASGHWRRRWLPERVVKGIPYDTPLPGRGAGNANFLRLWSAAAAEEFDLQAFHVGDYRRAVDEKLRSENIAKVLYPNDEMLAGKVLRLEQQHFFVSCALQDMIRLLLQRLPITEFANKFAIQLNDTHPSLAIPELMRLLMDEHDMGWDAAWELTSRAFSYTNHTLLPEALETWSLPLFARVLPRHLEIIYEINDRLLSAVRAKFPDDRPRLERMSIIGEGGEKFVRMAHLATVGSHTVNGVAQLHSELLQKTVLKDFAELWPERFTNVTNGVSQRRFLALSNPRLDALLGATLGFDYLDDIGRWKNLGQHADDPSFHEAWHRVKLANKHAFATWARGATGLTLDPSSLFDMQCKRMHEYKRQHLNLLHIAWLYNRILQRDLTDIVPRTFVFAGKAAPGYFMAKLILRLVHAIGDTINADPVARDHLRVVFVPNFNVQNAQRIYPAADLSEQISTAGREASGTGNMKFAMNGALTIGTLDGANVEIRDAVGPESFFLFGMTAEQVMRRQNEGYNPRAELDRDPELAGILHDIASGRYCKGEPGLFAPLVRTLVERDPFFVLADFRAYVECQQQVSRAFRDQAWWTAASIRNTAAMGPFSSDRSIAEYTSRIWKVKPVDIGR
jgi:glycogen phosphorylase